MAEGDANEADALSRLEAALDRIAQHSQRPALAASAAPAADTSEVAGRLDSLISELRNALAIES